MADDNNRINNPFYNQNSQNGQGTPGGRPNPYTNNSSTNRPNPYTPSGNRQNPYTNGASPNRAYPGGQMPNSNQPGQNNQQPNQNQVDDLRRLNNQLNRRDDDDTEEKKERIATFFKRFVVILLVLVLVGGIGFAVYFFTQKTGAVIETGTIKISTVLDKGLVNESGTQNNIEADLIYPGNKYPVKCVIRNSDNPEGDDNPNQYSNIFVRYSIIVNVDGVAYNNILVPEIPNLRREDWHIYNRDEEVASYVWDGYYYYYGALTKNQQLTLFDEVKFDFHNITNEFGNKKAEILITVEAVHADTENLGVEGGDAWNTAPRRWINNMKNGINNNNNKINI